MHFCISFIYNNFLDQFKLPLIIIYFYFALFYYIIITYILIY